ncbi:MAG: pyridoxamine 5'-phosphate oxidase family protein [Pseudomonadota bacterium]
MSRRELIQMTQDEIEDFIQTHKTLIIVSNGKDGYPHPMPMWFAINDDGTLDITTFRKSQKIFNYQRDNKASLLIEDGLEYEALRSVLIYADAEIIDDVDQTAETMYQVSLRSEQLKGNQVDTNDAAREAFKATARERAGKRLVVRFHPKEYITWDHSKLGGKY